jgi:protein-disulfide isomerase
VAYARLFEPAIPPDAPAVLKDLALDPAALEAAIKANTHAPALARAASSAADLELPTLPALFVNGRRFTGPPAEEEIRALVDEELARAEAATGSGTAPADLYASIMARATDLPEPEKRELPPPSSRAPWRGAERAPVVVQVFGDLQSPYSKRARGTLAELERSFTGSIKIVWRHRPLPIDKDAILAAEAALEAKAQKGDEGFWTFVDAVFEAQGRGPEALSRASLVGIAKKLGFDAQAFDAALASHAHRKEVEADARVADEAGIGGVPSYSINGWFLAGNVPYARLARAVDLALRDAQRETRP